MDKKTIVILGGGVGGLVSAVLLAEKLGKRHRIVVIDKESKHIFAPSFLWMMIGKREQAKFTREFEALKKRGVEYIKAEVKKIDVENKKVKFNSEEINYDYLIVALGAELYPQAIPGIEQAGYNLYDLASVEKLRDKVKDFHSGKIAVVVSSMPFKCPAAPYEAAMLLDGFFKNKKVRGAIEINLFTPEPQPLPIAGPEIGDKVKMHLRDKDIGYFPQFKIKEVDPKEKKLIFENSEKHDFDLLIFVPAHRAPEVVRESKLAGETGWIPIDREYLNTKYDNVYAIGDVTTMKLPSELMLPKSGAFAHSEAEVVAENIADEISGKTVKHKFNGSGICLLKTEHGKAILTKGDYFSAPKPKVKFYPTSQIWHMAKVLFEKYWMWRWF